MTIRELQYQIQYAIDEKGMDDTARLKLERNKDGELVLFAIGRLERIVEGGRVIPYNREVELGKI